MIKHVSAVAVAVLVAGCGPAWHDGKVRMTHSVERAATYGDSLSLQGEYAPIVAVSDYGFRVNGVRDDTGRVLRFKSYQIFWMKELRFEAEFEAPAATATSVHVDLEFNSRSGIERFQLQLPIEREPKVDYRTQLSRWDDAAVAE